MEILWLLVPLALLLFALVIRLFFWAVKSGQFDDLDTEGHRILFDDDTDAQPPMRDSNSDETKNDASPDR